MANTATVYYQISRILAVMQDDLLSRRKHETIHKGEVWFMVLTLSGWTSETLGPFKPGHPCSVEKRLLLYPVSNSLLG